ncbi:spore germination protein [Paenibacillus yanchengensis]|uniref:Spore germination protein n=1 Tax=Paenibacillus yanchengensis TaxID=2035833 RepID=A0ABW4YJT7_9BACL
MIKLKANRRRNSRTGSSKQDQEASQKTDHIPSNLEELKERLKNELGYKKSFDIVVREMNIAGKKVMFVYLSGLVNSDLLTDVLNRLTLLDDGEVSRAVFNDFFDKYVPAGQANAEDSWSKVLTNVLSGMAAFFMDGEHDCIVLDVRNYPSRSLEEPSLEKVVRGSRDGFVESIITNISLVRRRIRDPQLRYELLQVGERTQTDVVIAYIDDIVDHQLVDSFRSKVESIKIDGIPLADKQLEEATIKRGWNPFPLVRYSERPDTVSSHLLEGAVVVFVDSSPSVMILPTTYADLVQHAEEIRQTPFIGTYLRWVRFFGIIASLIMLPLWLLFVMYPEFKPASLDFLGPEKVGKIPLFVQFLIAELGIDLMRMASVHTPSSLSTAMSLVAAILIGDIAVQTGLFNNEVILYMAVSAVGMFATPSYELGLANRIVRLVLILAVAIFGAPGLVVTAVAIFLALVCERSLNRPYMWPFIPFDLQGMISIILRKPVLFNRKRPNILRPQQQNKMPSDN